MYAICHFQKIKIFKFLKVNSMFLAIITMSMILKKQTNLFSNDYNSFISLVSLVTKVIS